MHETTLGTATLASVAALSRAEGARSKFGASTMARLAAFYIFVFIKKLNLRKIS